MGTGTSVTTKAAAAALLLAAVLAAFTACGRDGGIAPAAERRLVRAGEVAAAARAEADELRSEVEELSGRIAAVEERAASAAALEQRLQRASKRLWKAIREARRELEAVKASAASAAERVDAALAEAETAMRDLKVLRDRYDYHLRRYHGGG